jgi:hypothetical protein
MTRKIIAGIAVVLLVAATVGYSQWVVPRRQAVGIGASMLAKQMCSCVFVAERDVEDCRADQLASLDPIQFELGEDHVRAFVPLLGERVATWSEGLGCTLQ